MADEHADTAGSHGEKRTRGPMDAYVEVAAAASEEPPTKKPRTLTAGWECPVCYDLRFPFIGTCGHSICEDCFDDITDCPVCRKSNCFIREQPNWDLASGYNLTRDPNRNALGFGVKRSGLVRTRDQLSAFQAMMCETQGDASVAHVAEMGTALNRMCNIFNTEVATSHAQTIMAKYRRAQKFPLKIDITGCTISYSFLAHYIDDRYSDVSCQKRKVDTKMLLYLKPV